MTDIKFYLFQGNGHRVAIPATGPKQAKNRAKKVGPNLVFLGEDKRSADAQWKDISTIAYPASYFK